MALAHPVKLVLKSTTTQTLSDRFTEMMRNKSPATTRQRERVREENIALSRASAKNRRLAEQMSNRRDPVMDQFQNANSANGGGDVNVKSRLDQSRINARSNVRERLGRTNNVNGNVQTRLGGTRGGAGGGGGGGGGGRLRGRSLSRGRLDNGTSRSFNGRGPRPSPRRGGTGGGFNRGAYQQRVGRFQGGRARGRGGGGDNRGGGRGFTRGRFRSRGRGRGGRGGGGGGGGNRFVDRGDLDSELDTYMSKM